MVPTTPGRDASRPLRKLTAADVMEEGVPARSWTLALRAPCPWLNANDRVNRYVKADYTRRWRTAAWVAAKQAKLPTGLERVRVLPVLHFPQAAHRDAPNYHVTIKACIDGLGPAFVRMPSARSKGASAVGYGLIVDDTAEHLDLHEPVIGPLYGEVAKSLGLPPASRGHWGALVLAITDLSSPEGT